MPNFPTSLDALANPSSTTLRNDPGFSLAGAVSTLNDIAEALEAKLGIGASAPAGAAAVLRRTAAGASAWGQVAAGDYAAASVAAADINAAAVTRLLGWYGPLGANQASFDFTAIPQTYKSLRLVWQGRSTIAATTDIIALRVNGIVGGFYYCQYTAGTGTGTSSGETIGTTYDGPAGIAGSLAAAGACGGGVTDIPNYALAGAFIKTWHSVSGLSWNTTTGTMQQKTQYSTLYSTPAITQITINPVGGQWVAGSYVALYGLN